MFFPIAVATVFCLARSTPVDPNRQALLYAIPILLLTLADAGAALVGIRYGTVSYSTEDGTKTLEGSLSFLLVAFFCVHVPILLATNVGRPETLLIALLLAFLTTMSEAVAWRGLDNLFLPLLAFYLLEIYLDMSLEKLTIRAAVMVGLIAFVLVYRRFTTIAGSGILGAALFGYAAWALGGPAWLVPPLVFFVAYSLLSPPTPTTSQQVHNAMRSCRSWRPGSSGCFCAQNSTGRMSARSVYGRLRGEPEPHRRGPLPMRPAPSGPAFARRRGAPGLAHHCACRSPSSAASPRSRWRRPRRRWWVAVVAVVSSIGSSRSPTDAANTRSTRPRWFRQGMCAAIGSLAGLAVCWTGVRAVRRGSPMKIVTTPWTGDDAERFCALPGLSPLTPELVSATARTCRPWRSRMPHVGPLLALVDGHADARGGPPRLHRPLRRTRRRGGDASC